VLPASDLKTKGMEILKDIVYKNLRFQTILEKRC